jgi:hypothetical protein
VLFVSPSDSSERATIASVAPARAYCGDISCLILRDAPVTSTTLPWNTWAAYSGCGSMAGQTLRIMILHLRMKRLGSTWEEHTRYGE